MSDEIENTDAGKSEHPNRLLAAVILVVSIAAVAAPILIVQTTLYDEYGISENALLSELVLPGVSLLVMLLTVVLMARSRVRGILDVVWYRRTRSEAAWAILLIIAVTLCLVTGVLLRKVGLPTRPDFWFWADQQGLAFFVTVTILLVVLGPILEELFWRGYVQASLERVSGRFFAWLGQAVLFAAVHLRPLGGFVLVLFLGMMLGAWRSRRRTLLPIILAHMAVNGLWCAARWPGWIDCTRIRITTDYLAEYQQIAGVAALDPKDNARNLYEKASQSAVDVPAEFERVKDVWPERWSPEQRAAMSAWLSAGEQALDYVEEGSQKPYYWPELTDDIVAAGIPELSWVRSAAFALYARSQVRAANGEANSAFSDISTCLRLAGHFVGRRVLVSQLVGFSIRASAIKRAFRIIDNTDVPPAVLADLQTELEELRNTGVHSMDYAVERLVFHDHVQRMFTDDGKGSGHIPEIALRIPGRLKSLLTGPSEQQRQKLLKLDRRETTTLVDLYFRFLEDAAKMSAWGLRNDATGVRKDMEMIMKRNAFIEMFGEAYIKTLSVPARVKTDLEALIATLAILRYDAEQGRLPASLQALVDEGYLKVLPQDSFSDGPLVYKQTAGAFLLYSVGLDFDDDGGTPSKWGEGEQGGDQVFWPVQESDADTEPAGEAQAQ